MNKDEALNKFTFMMEYRNLSSTHFGPSSAARTHGLLVPNQARYQLRYTRMYYIIITGQNAHVQSSI